MYSDGLKEPLYQWFPFSDLSGSLSNNNSVLLVETAEGLQVRARDTGHTDVWATVDFCGDTFTAATSVDVSNVTYFV